MSILLTKSGKKFTDAIFLISIKKEAEVFTTLTSEEKEVLMVLEKLAMKLKGEN